MHVWNGILQSYALWEWDMTCHMHMGMGIWEWDMTCHMHMACICMCGCDKTPWNRCEVCKHVKEVLMCHFHQCLQVKVIGLSQQKDRSSPLVTPTYRRVKASSQQSTVLGSKQSTVLYWVPNSTIWVSTGYQQYYYRARCSQLVNIELNIPGI